MIISVAAKKEVFRIVLLIILTTLIASVSLVGLKWVQCGDRKLQDQVKIFGVGWNHRVNFPFCVNTGFYTKDNSRIFPYMRYNIRRDVNIVDVYKNFMPFEKWLKVIQNINAKLEKSTLKKARRIGQSIKQYLK